MLKALKFQTSAVLLMASILLCGFAHRSWLGNLGDAPDPIALACDLAHSIHRAATNFQELSERMDPTCSECNQP